MATLLFVWMPVLVVSLARFDRTSSRVLSSSYKSILGDPGMRSQAIHIAIEGWNFCNRAGTVPMQLYRYRRQSGTSAFSQVQTQNRRLVMPIVLTERLVGQDRMETEFAFQTTSCRRLLSRYRASRTRLATKTFMLKRRNGTWETCAKPR